MWRHFRRFEIHLNFMKWCNLQKPANNEQRMSSKSRFNPTKFLIRWCGALTAQRVAINTNELGFDFKAIDLKSTIQAFYQQTIINAPYAMTLFGREREFVNWSEELSGSKLTVAVIN